MKIPFEIVTDKKPAGSQPEAIASLLNGLNKDFKQQTLLGATGTGKTFTIAHIIAAYNKPAIVLAHNKTLAAQLYNELKELFPKNRVEYFVSYYDYYQPESYVPRKDLYIEKDAQINPEIERMRLAATASLATREDTIIVASVSCIYGLGDPRNFTSLGFEITKNTRVPKKKFLQKIIEILYERNDIELKPGRFRVKGDTIDIIPGYMKDIIRITFFGDEIDEILLLDAITLDCKEELSYFFLYPAKHFVSTKEELQKAIKSIKAELEETLPSLPPLERQRLEKRTLYDIELIEETGTCKGIENYSRHFEGRKEGEKPFVLLDYFSKEFLIIIDESHQTIPQYNGMYKGDYSRKKNLVDYGFRLKSALDNRPLKFVEFEEYLNKNKTIFVSATPAEYEIRKSKQIVEQIIRPTGLLDPIVKIHPLKNHMTHIKEMITKAIAKGNRAILTTLTKKNAEELTEYLSGQGIACAYLHADIQTIQRTEIIRDLRLKKFDVLVGINLLREGIDIPEVGFVGILDADKEGFLRNERSLIQIIGRAARNKDSFVYLYADNETESIKRAMNETKRRRSIQLEYNKKHSIVPQTILKKIEEPKKTATYTKSIPKNDIPKMIIELESEMRIAADKLDFEKAITIRNRITQLQKILS